MLGETLSVANLANRNQNRSVAPAMVANKISDTSLASAKEANRSQARLLAKIPAIHPAHFVNKTKAKPFPLLKCRNFIGSYLFNDKQIKE